MIEDYKTHEFSRYTSRLKGYNRKYPREMTNIRKNLDRTLYLVDELDISIHQLARSFAPLRCEFDDVFRVTQQGTGAGLAQVRLYFRIEKPERFLYLLGLGTKDRQSADIKYCKAIVREIAEQNRSRN